MLHMIVNTHNPESCAFRGDEEEKVLAGAFERFEEQAGEEAITIRGSWVNRGAHEAFALVDAPNAHVIEEGLLRAGLIGRTHTRVLAVVSTDEAIPEDE